MGKMGRVEQIIAGKGIRILFQPIISVRTKSLIGFEALMRAVDPLSGEAVSPPLLFEEARQAHLILELDRECRYQAFAAFAPIHRANDSLILFLNFESSIIDMGVVGSGHLIRTADEFRINPENVVIEIVESKVSDENAMRRFISSHRDRGFLIALDDVGEGHSSLNRISLVRPDIIKIDRSIICGIDKEYYKKKIVEALHILSRGTGALLLAEGVETEEEAVESYEAGADLFQGYFFSKPVDPCVSISDYSSLVERIADKYRRKAMDSLSARKNAEHRFFAAMEKLSALLMSSESALFPEHLRRWLETLSDCECVYLLDLSGRQIGPTVCSETARKGVMHSPILYHPAESGADHSQKEYYYAMAGLDLSSFMTDPYISLATGSVCRTASIRFPNTAGDEFILCADFNCT